MNGKLYFPRYDYHFNYRVSENLPPTLEYEMMGSDTIQAAIILLADSGNIENARKILDDVDLAWKKLKK